MTPVRTWLVSGASSGIGRSLAEVLLDAGEQVLLTARRPEVLQDLAERWPSTALTARLDVTHPQHAAEAVAAGLERFGRLDVLVANAGYGLLGALEDLDEDELRTQLDTNFFGAVRVVRAALPVMRQQRAGHVVVISSVGGFAGVPGAGAYNASKFALEGAAEALAAEAAPLGVRVTIVEPGAFRTGFAGGLRRARRRTADYDPVAGAVRDAAPALGGTQPGDPVKAARAVLAAVRADQPPLRLVLGRDALATVEAKLAAVQRDLDDWRTTATGTDLDAG